MKKLSKILSVGLSLVMCASMVTPAFAASFAELQRAINTGKSVYQDDGETYKIEASKNEAGAVNIKLHEQVTDTEKANQITVNNKDVTIDLNGNEIVANNTKTNAQAILVFGAKATLTVEDSSKEKTGTIEGSGTQVITNNGGTLNLNGGTVKSTGTGTEKAVYVQGGTVNISENATVISGRDTKYEEVNGKRVLVDTDVGVYVNGGTVNTEGNIEGYNGVKIATGTVNVTGGTITGYNGVQTVTGGTVNVTNGTVKGDRNGILARANNSVTVTGGSVEGATGNGIYLEGNCTATVDGANTTVKGGSTGVLLYGEGTSLTVKDGTIEGEASYGISGNGQYHGTDIKVLGGIVTGGYTGIYHPQDGKLTIGKENGTGPVITGKKGVGVQMCAGEGIIYGGTIQGSGEDLTENKTGDGTIADGAAVSLVSRQGYGLGNQNSGRYSQPKVTIHTDHVKLINGTATYQWANPENPGQKPDDWNGDEKTSGIFEVTHDSEVGIDQYYTKDFIVIDPRVEPTYTSTGWTEGSHCKICGHVFVPQEPIPMLTRPGSTPVTSGTVIPDGNVPMGELPGADAGIEIEDEAVPLAGLFTRADAIGYLWEQSGSPEWELSDFEDVPEDHYWAVAIGWAQDMGIAVADEDGNSRPDDLVLRSVESLEISPEGELQEFLNRYAVYAGIELDADELFIELDGAWDDVIMGEEAQVIFDDFFAKLEEALADLAA